VLAAASAVFGGDKVILSRQKLVYEKRSGLASTSIRTIGISDIVNVTGAIGPIFGVIRFTTSTPEFPDQVGLFWRRDAIRMKRVIDGYVIAFRRNIDVTTIPAEKLVPMLVQLGTDDASITR
jgi:hypothetical protein